MKSGGMKEGVELKMRGRVIALLAALVIVFALVPGVASAAPAITQGIQGVVRDSATGLPIPFADVHVDYAAGPHIAYLKADWNGTYSIALAPDDYFIEAYSRLYDSQQFEPVTVDTDTVTTQNFSLVVDTITPEQPVYRFFNMPAGVHFYTASTQEFLNVYQGLNGVFHYDGIAYWVPVGASTDPGWMNPNTMPLYRFFNKKTGVHFYTMSEQEKATIQNTLADRYAFEGVAYYVTGDPVGTLPVHRYYVPRRDTHFFTADTVEMLSVGSKLSNYYHYEGIGFYIGNWEFVGEE